MHYLEGQDLGGYHLSTLIIRTKNSEIYQSYDPSTSQKLAIKVYDYRFADTQSVENEISLMEEISSPYVVHPIYTFLDDYYRCIVMPLYSNGDLFDFIDQYDMLAVESNYEGTRESVAVQIMYQALRALEYLHSIGIWHRDIKPENFLVEDRSLIVPKVLLCDFGYAKKFPSGAKCQEDLGTLLYNAPEIIKGEPYDESVDIWAMGVIMYILLSGETPFPTNNNKIIRDSILEGTIDCERPSFNKVSPQGKSLIHKMLQYNPENRISASDALQDDWFKTFFPNPTVPRLKRAITDQLGIPFDDDDFTFLNDTSHT